MPNSYMETIKNVIGSWLGQSSEDNGEEPDAIAMLTADHRRVDALVAEFKSAEDQEKKSICAKILLELTIHTRLEEELVYPLLQREDDEEDKALSDEAYVEHDCVKYLIQQLAGEGPSDERFDAKVTVLAEIVQHHVKEEERELFPSLRATDNDMNELGAKIKARKKELMQAMHKKPEFSSSNGSAKKSSGRAGAKGAGGASAGRKSASKSSSKGKSAGSKAKSKSGSAAKGKGAKSSSSKSTGAAKKTATSRSSSSKSKSKAARAGGAASSGSRKSTAKKSSSASKSGGTAKSGSKTKKPASKSRGRAK